MRAVVVVYGFERWPSIPAAMHASESPSMAFASPPHRQVAARFLLALRAAAVSRRTRPHRHRLHENDVERVVLYRGEAFGAVRGDRRWQPRRCAGRALSGGSRWCPRPRAREGPRRDPSRRRRVRAVGGSPAVSEEPATSLGARWSGPASTTPPHPRVVRAPPRPRDVNRRQHDDLRPPAKFPLRTAFATPTPSRCGISMSRSAFEPRSSAAARPRGPRNRLMNTRPRVPRRRGGGAG